MFDSYIGPLVQPFLVRIVKKIPSFITPNMITWSGFGLGMLGAGFVAMSYPLIGLIGVVLNRIADGLDGALARERGSSDAGGFLDITCDFIFYAAVPLGFLIMDPTQNSLAAGVLLFSFIGTEASFLAYAIMVEKNKIAPQPTHKSFEYLTGITEGTETILFLVVICIFPEYFSVMAWVYAVLCMTTTVGRLYFGYLELKKLLD